MAKSLRVSDPLPPTLHNGLLTTCSSVVCLFKLSTSLRAPSLTKRDGVWTNKKLQASGRMTSSSTCVVLGARKWLGATWNLGVPLNHNPDGQGRNNIRFPDIPKKKKSDFLADDLQVWAQHPKDIRVSRGYRHAGNDSVESCFFEYLKGNCKAL